MAQMQDEDPPTILVVEDEALLRMDGADMIEEAGFRVLEASSADEAIAILESAGNVRLIFSDVDMPGSMNGLKLADFVHRRWPGIRLLLTSGHHALTNRDIPDDGRFIAKPYSCARVVSEIRTLLPDD
jgi:CheY-like chemotaxis protein